MQNKNISVVVPLTRIHYLDELLESLAEQRLSGDFFEVILVSAKDILIDRSRYDFDIKIIKTQEKLSPAVARNTGVKEASADFIVFTDDDCLFDSSWLQSWRDFIQTKDVSVASARILPLDITHLIQRFCLFKGIVCVKDQSAFKGFLITANCMFRKDVFNGLMGFDSRFDFAGGEDTDISLRAKASGYKIDFCQNSLVYHRHPAGVFYWLKKYFYYGMAMHNVFNLNPNASEFFESKNYNFLKIFSLFKIPFKIVESLKDRKHTGVMLVDIIIFPFLSYFFNVVFNVGMLFGRFDKNE